MDTARQILRYSIPGTVFIFAVLCAQSIMRVAWGDPVDKVLSVEGTSSVVAALAASVPIGFLIYQLYYGGYRPRKFIGRLPTLDRGAVVLAHLTCRQRAEIGRRLGRSTDCRQATRERSTETSPSLLSIVSDVFRLKFLELVEWRSVQCPDEGENCAGCLPPNANEELNSAYDTRWRDNWLVVMAALDVGEDRDSLAEIKREYTNLSDIYHALGACRTALAAALMLVVTYDLLQHWSELADHVWPSVWGASIALLGGLYLLTRLHKARTQTEKSVLNRLGLGLRSVLPEASGA